MTSKLLVILLALHLSCVKSTVLTAPPMLAQHVASFNGAWPQHRKGSTLCIIRWWCLQRFKLAFSPATISNLCLF